MPADRAQRIIAAATFVNMLGSGVFMAAASLFFTQSVGLSLAQVGTGLGIATLTGLLAGVPVGRLADRLDPREVYLGTLAVQGAAMTALVFVHSFWLFVLVVSLTELAGSAAAASRAPLVRGYSGAEPTRFRSYLRSVANLGGAGGALAAGFAIQLGTRDAYLALVLGNAVSFLACAVIILRLPSLPPLPVPPQAGRWQALKDRPYLAVAVLDGLIGIQGHVLVFALPLWIVLHSDAPRWFVGVSVLVNTGMVVLLQVRASRGVDSPAAAGRAVRRSGLAFLAGMGLIAVTGGLPGWLAIVVITLGICVHTTGELWHAAGSLELRFRLAPAYAQGQYAGVYGLGLRLGGAAAPATVGLLCVSWGAPGWLALGGLFAVAGYAMPLVIRWAENGQRTGSGRCPEQARHRVLTRQAAPALS
ncbi:MFS transporter [Longispora albida]|uniref:MFS transporter n=1 Tax=Longispora albida TaxID=203523 RepID=UPI001FE0E629|nr:MFS transporter [Longispora albida]